MGHSYVKFLTCQEKSSKEL